jgi:hypothetical protein
MVYRKKTIIRLVRYIIHISEVAQSHAVSQGFESQSGNQLSRHGLTNVMVEWLALLLRILKVAGSNLGKRPVIATKVLVVFLSSSR